MTNIDGLRECPTPKQDLAGKRFGRLLVVRFAGRRRDGRPIWECVCDCGSRDYANAKLLLNGEKQSCGCLMREINAELHYKHGHAGDNPSREYNAWQNMLTRCENENRDTYRDYGGRGIVICERWRTSFANFHADMGDCPPKMTLDRIDVNGGYEPGNCRWANSKTQNTNRRNTVMVEFRGETKPLVDWCEQLGIKYYTAITRLKKGMSAEDILNPGKFSNNGKGELRGTSVGGCG